MLSSVYNLSDTTAASGPALTSKMAASTKVTELPVLYSAIRLHTPDIFLFFYCNEQKELTDKYKTIRL